MLLCSYVLQLIIKALHILFMFIICSKRDWMLKTANVLCHQGIIYEGRNHRIHIPMEDNIRVSVNKPVRDLLPRDEFFVRCR